MNNIIIKSNDREKINVVIKGDNNTCIIEENVTVEDCLSIYIVGDNSYVYVGKGTTFESTTISLAEDKNRVIIHNDCMFARETSILASDFHSIFRLDNGERKNRTKGIQIDNHVWVGYRSVITKNSHIMSNAIVGANEVVRGVVLPNAIYAKQSGRDLEYVWERERDTKISRMKPVSIWEGKKLQRCHYDENILLDISVHNPFFNKVEGWVARIGTDLLNTNIYLGVESNKEGWKYYELEKFARKDVADYLQDERCLWSGIAQYMPAEIIKKRIRYVLWKRF